MAKRGGKGGSDKWEVKRMTYEGIKGGILEMLREWGDWCPGFNVGLKGSKDTCQLLFSGSEENGMQGPDVRG